MSTNGVPHLAELLNQLFQRIPPADASSPDDRYSTSRAAREISERGTPITDVYLGKLRNGAKSNPSFRHLSAIADLFGVPLDYFRDPGIAQSVIEELDTLQATRHAQITGIMKRSHQDNLQFGLAQIKAIIAAMEESAAQQFRNDEDDDSPPQKDDRA